MFDIVIRNGLVVNQGNINKLDIAVKDGVIKEVKNGIRGNARQIIEAKNYYVFPGIIDVHTHFNLPVMGTFSSDDFFSGTRAAACGGVTTVIDFATPLPGQDLLDAVNKRLKEADGECCIDYSLHATINYDGSDVLPKIKKIIKYGIPSFKLYLVYDGLRLDMDAFKGVVEKIYASGGLPVVHAESYELLKKCHEKLKKEGKIKPGYHYESRPEEVEIRAIKEVLNIIKELRAKVYFVHVSTKEGLEAIKKNQNYGLGIFAETCPQYLLLTKEVYKRKDGIFYLAVPPLRTKSDRNALWGGLKDGVLQVVSTDHCPFKKEQKSMGKDFIFDVPNGIPGVETSLVLLYTFGVRENKIFVEKMIELLCHNPAKIFGLSHCKGFIKEGLDADLVIFDPEYKKTIHAQNLKTNCDFSPYEGFKIKGWPKMTILRGNIICENETFKGRRGMGKFVKRYLNYE